MKKIVLTLIATLTLCFAPVHAADFQKGLDALDNGDYAAALIEFKSLAEQGHAKAQYYLGEMYSYGMGVVQDDKEAGKWFRFAAEQGYADAQNYLGVMYYDGQGVARDYKEAVKWYRRAAEQGDAYAQHNLGWMYDIGKGVARDYKEAVKWYRRAAEQGHADAQNNLGVMYRKGKGVAQDYVRTHMWFNISSASGDDKAGGRRDRIAAKMTSEDISKAQSMAKECMDSNYKNCGY